MVSRGATSLERIKTRKYSVPTYPGDDPADWRSADPKLRKSDGAQFATA